MDIKARNLASTGLEHGLQLVKSSFSSYSSPIIGNFNNGSYKVTLNTSEDESGSNLKYNHYGLLKSEAEIGGVKRNVRLILSSYRMHLILHFTEVMLEENPLALNQQLMVIFILMVVLAQLIWILEK